MGLKGQRGAGGKEGEDRGKGGVRACGGGERGGGERGEIKKKRKCIYSNFFLVILSKMM
jgi:hypothetical protein